MNAETVDKDHVVDVEKSLHDVDSEAPQSPNAIEMTPMEYRKLIWKLDIHLLPPLFALWFVSLIDRINIGSANLFGIQKTLGMNAASNDFNIALIVVVIGLVTMEVPSNWLLKKTRPSIVLAVECLLLGVFTIAEGVVKTKEALYAVRFFIGVFEAGLIPGSVYLLAQYYPRYELQWRVSMLMVSNALSTAFGGLLALAIAGIKSSNGYAAWRWIFIIEGCFTCGVTILVYFLLSDWPTSAKWLKPEELAVLQQKIRGQGLIGRMDRLDAKAIFRTLTDWKIYVSGAMVCCTTVTVYSVAIFSPTIIAKFQPGHSSRHVQALVIPIFVAAMVGTLTIAYISDKIKHRSSFAFLGFMLTIAGSSILVNQAHVSANTKYGALYLMTIGSYISLPMLWVMLVNNVSGTYKIGIAVALEVGLGNLGGIASALVFQGKQAPLYTQGYHTILYMSITAACLVVVYAVGLWIENRARDAGKRDHRLSHPDIDNFGDDHPHFRYGY